MNKGFYTLLSIIAVTGVGGTTAIHHHYSNQYNTYKTEGQSEHAKILNTRNSIPKITYNNVKKSDETTPSVKVNQTKKTPNLDKPMRISKQKMVSGLKLAFNDCHTMKQYKSNYSKIMNDLGYIIGSDVLNAVKPQTSQAFKHPVGISNNIINMDIGYGKVGSGEKVPVSIVVFYETPKYNNNAGAGAGSNNKPTRHTGHFVLNGGVNLTNYQTADSDCFNHVDD